MMVILKEKEKKEAETEKKNESEMKLNEEVEGVEENKQGEK